MKKTAKARRVVLTLALATAATLPMWAHAQADKGTIDALEGYFDFVDANGGTIMAEQLGPDDCIKLLHRTG